MKTVKRKYTGFLIDADNTIFDFNRCEREALKHTLDKFKLTGLAEKFYNTFSRINRDLWKRYELNQIDINQLKIERFILFCKTTGIKYNPVKMSALFLEILSQKSYILPYVTEILDYLSRRALICLITNGASFVQKGRIARAGIEVFFTDILISEDIGFYKPNPQFFLHACKRLNLPCHQVLCVGDSPSADIRGAKLAGIDACWFMYQPMSYPTNEPIPDYIISDLRELKKFVPELQ